MADTALYPWLQPQWRHVIRLHATGRLPHALLLHGGAGIGKAEFATALANYLLCQQPAGEQVCGRCRGCELNRVGSHPDLFRLAPEEVGKQIRVDQVRQLTDFVYSTAQQGGYRVIILDPVDAMNVAAANALLKMLEEPGSDTILMLITHRLGQVMPTIKSRCQRVECSAPQEEAAAQWVATRLGVDREQAVRLLRITNGAPKAALDFSAQGLEEVRNQLVKGLADVLRQRRSVCEVAQAWQKFDLELLLGWFYSMLCDVARQTAASGDCIRQLDARNMLAAVAKGSDPEKVFRLASRVQAERGGLMLRQNPNKQLLLEALLLEWAALVK